MKWIDVLHWFVLKVYKAALLQISLRPLPYKKKCPETMWEACSADSWLQTMIDLFAFPCCHKTLFFKSPVRASWYLKNLRLNRISSSVRIQKFWKADGYADFKSGITVFVSVCNPLSGHSGKCQKSSWVIYWSFLQTCLHYEIFQLQEIIWAVELFLTGDTSLFF